MGSPNTKEIIHHMLSKDRFSAWMGIKVLESSAGYCTLTMTIRDEMLNGFDIVHGGITFALADTALAVASNSHNRLSVALEASISYPVAVKVNETLTAKAIELSKTNKIGVYQILVTNGEDIRVAIFKGTVYRTSKTLLESD